LQSPSLLKRAGTEKLREVFLKYASIQKNGEHYMTSEDFVRKFLGLFSESAFNDVSTQYVPAFAGHCKVILHSLSDKAGHILSVDNSPRER